MGKKKSGERRLKTSIRPEKRLYNFCVTKNNELFSDQTIRFQSLLRPALTPVLRNRDYERLVADLQQLDRNLIDGGMERLAGAFALSQLPEDASAAQRSKKVEFAVYALRVELLRHLFGLPGFEAFSVSLASSDLLSDFCGCRSLLGVKWTSKSSLHRASTFFSDEQLREFNTRLVELAGNQSHCPRLGLEEAEDLSVCLVDSTCLEANIHFPVDWVLLRDVTRTLLKAVKLIRREGLLWRMPDSADQLLRRMNKLCIRMTHTRRKKGAVKARKAILRKMKKLLKRIGAHARRHRDLLEARFEQTRFSRARADQVIARIDGQLDLLPKAIEQAHERIIGGRLVKNEDKILSAYERDIDVIVRGKAGAQTEFGNELFMAENPGGMIIDYKLYGKSAPGEGDKLLESVKRQQSFKVEQNLEAAVADRGFDGSPTLDALRRGAITSHICPKNPSELEARLKEPEFCRWQTRRAGTEARIAIVKNHGGGRVWRAKGLKHRQLAVGWSVLAHNLAWISRKVREQRLKALAGAA